mmetsp:Transcript_35106/g.54741  ORF Transcript_35106/g.54741 Transcript_35106/m.54741 type:complete len:206 (+) Transcript_35106:1079-1696(+)
MRNKEKRLLPARKIIFEPDNSRDIKVIGRFVKNQQIRLSEQSTSKSNTHSPSSRILSCLFDSHFFVGETQTKQNFLGTSFGGMSVNFSHSFVNIIQIVRLLKHFVLNFVIFFSSGKEFFLLDKPFTFLVRLQNSFERGSIITSNLLLDMQNRDVFRDVLERFFSFRESGHQDRFSQTVSTNNTVFVTRDNFEFCFGSQQNFTRYS